MNILVAILAYNEEANIADTIYDLQSNNFGYDLIVIDDGSYDRTKKICQDLNVPVLSHPMNIGSFGAVKTYFIYAFRYQYDILCQFDGDGQHIAAELSTIIDPIRNKQADYVIGSRYIEKHGYQSTALRRTGIKLFSKLASRTIGKKITDSTSGFRAYNRNVIELFGKRYPYEIHDTIQLLLLAHYHGARIQEVPVKMKARQHGTSEFNAVHSVKYFLRVFVNFIGCSLQKNQIR